MVRVMQRPNRLSTLLLALLVTLSLSACGGATGSVTIDPSSVRTGPPVDLLGLVPSSAVVVLQANLDSTRQDPVRYERIAAQLATELGLTAEAGTLRALLDRAEHAVGVFAPSPDGGHEGMLMFTGRFADADFERAVGIATQRHGGGPVAETGAEGRRILAFGNAALVQFDTWTWAVVQGAGLRAHLARAPLHGGRAFSQNLIEFGPRIGLPQGSARAWASQQSPAGVDMVALVFAGENPEMVHNFVSTVRRHLGL